MMTDNTLFKAAYPYQETVLALPTVDLDTTAAWYMSAFNMTEAERSDHPVPTVILKRDDVKIGLAVTGGDPEQDGAAILVTDIDRAKAELESNGVETGELKTEDRNGQKFRVFFVIAPDGLCFYFHQPVAD